MMRTRSVGTVLTVVAMTLATAIPVALGGGPSEETFKANDAWLCEDDGFVTNHCLSMNSRGKVLNILVFDPRGPQESASADPRADSWPCPHDSGGTGPFGTDPTGGDGTWWNFLYGSGDALYVCHHSGQQQFLP